MEHDKKRINIGLLANNFHNGFEIPIWRGISKAAILKDVNLFSYPGGQLRNWMQLRSYNLVNKDLLDGLIVITGAIEANASNEEVCQFFDHFGNLPIVSISRKIERAYNLQMDNYIGMKHIVDHLIDHHKFQNIAFISGPQNNSDAQVRLRAYKDSLKEHGIPYNEQFVYYGDFIWRSGIKAVNEFIDIRKLNPDAIVSSNDYMALYAMKELKLRGYRIPEDIAITGFDDITEAKNVKPSLTTVMQPLEQLGQEALHAILESIHENVQKNIKLPTRVVLRETCGCNSARNEIVVKEKHIYRTNDEIDIDKIAEDLNETFFGLNEQLKNEGWSKDICTSFYEDIRERNGALTTVINKYAQICFKQKIKITIWFTLMRELETIFCSYTSVKQYSQNIKGILNDAFELIGNLIYEFHLEEMNAFETKNTLVERLDSELNFFDIEILKKNLSEVFTILNINSFFLALYDNNDQNDAILIHHFLKNDKNFQMIDEKTVFPSQKLFPGKLTNDKRVSFIVSPVLQIGFALLEISELNDIHFQSISHITSIVKFLSMINAIKKTNYQLESKIQELKNTQHQLVETAHQAGMAEISIGVMHNVGNIINSINTSSEEIVRILESSKIQNMKKVNEIFNAYKEDLKTCFSSDPKIVQLPEYYQKMTDVLQSEYDKLKSESNQLVSKISLIQGSIRTLQNYASGGPEISFNEKLELKSILENAIKIQESQIVDHRVQLIRKYGKEVLVETQRIKLIHVMVNLIKNAIEAMKSMPLDNRRLIIEIDVNSAGIPYTRITDTGCGILPDNLNKMFTYGFTTKKNGHGFGLHTCANYIKEIGGKIIVESHGDGQGTTFIIEYPRTAEPKH